GGWLQRLADGTQRRGRRAPPRTEPRTPASRGSTSSGERRVRVPRRRAPADGWGREGAPAPRARTREGGRPAGGGCRRRGGGPRRPPSPLGAKYVVSTPVGIADTVAPGASEASSARSASDTARVSFACRHARASYRRILRHSSSRSARCPGGTFRLKRFQIMYSTLCS